MELYSGNYYYNDIYCISIKSMEMFGDKETFVQKTYNCQNR